MKFNWNRLVNAYKELKDSRWFRNFLTFLGFVAISLLFWVIMALNDNVQDNLEVRLNISNTPDSVTFITVPPSTIHVSVRDKGTSLLRSGMIQRPVIDLNFRDFGHDGVFKVSRGDFQSALKSAFGPNASITSASIDSISLVYTTNPGKRVPVVVDCSVTAANGKTISSIPFAEPSAVQIYSSRDITDTVTRVFTESFIRRNLTDPTTLEVKLKAIPGARIIPDKVTVKIPVEPLVKKESVVSVDVLNVPDNQDLLLFPHKARVVYYVPMSKFNSSEGKFVVSVDYNDTQTTPTSRLPLYLNRVPSYAVNAELVNDSVEYTVVRDR